MIDFTNPDEIPVLEIVGGICGECGGGVFLSVSKTSTALPDESYIFCEKCGELHPPPHQTEEGAEARLDL